METLALSPERYNAHMVATVIATTAPPGEQAEAARLRAASIIEMFKGFEPATALESLHACQCIALRFVLMGALRAVLAANPEDARLLVRLQASVVSLTRAVRISEARYDALKARGDARAAIEAEADALARKTPSFPETGAPERVSSEPAVAEADQEEPPVDGEAAPVPPRVHPPHAAVPGSAHAPRQDRPRPGTPPGMRPPPGSAFHGPGGTEERMAARAG